MSETLQIALARHRAGAVRDAEQLYRRILATEPDNFDARYGLAVALHAQGQAQASLEHFERAARLRPDDADVQLDLGTVLGQLGHLEQSIVTLQKAARLAPASTIIADALARARANEQHLLAVEYSRQGRLEEAARCCRRILELLPNVPNAYENLANVLFAQGKLDEAEQLCRRALELDERCGAAHQRLGLIAMQRRQLAEAERHFRRLVELLPERADSHNQLGASLIHQDRLTEAEASFRRAVAIDPNHADGLNNLGTSLAKQRRFDEAVACFERLLAAHPDYAEGLFNLGKTFDDQQRPLDAVVCFRRALERKPDYHDAELDLAFTLLKIGRLVEGWPHYEARFKLPDMQETTRFHPTWQGDDLRGRTILLGREQGFGDMLQFVRYAELVRQRGGRVLVECLPPLAPLVSRTRGVDGIYIPTQPRPYFEAFQSLLSLPGVFGTTMDTIPADVPYLSADPALIDEWRAEFAGQQGLKVGIVWQGNKGNKTDARRSIPLASFAPLARVAGVRLFSLQVGHGREQLEAFPDWQVVDLGARLRHFGDTAAVMEHLDLVITCDSAPAHLAGALGRPVWVALSTPADWRWFLDREDSPWYPTMRLFRQQRGGEWGEVFERLAAELAGRAAPSGQLQRGFDGVLGG